MPCNDHVSSSGGATIELEKSLAEGAGLLGGHSSPELEEARQRVRLEEIVLKDSVWSRYSFDIYYQHYYLLQMLKMYLAPDMLKTERCSPSYSPLH